MEKEAERMKQPEDGEHRDEMLSSVHGVAGALAKELSL